jgi:hypothetical protein
MKEGRCNLCSKKGMLNYEHVPPRSSGNKTTRFKTGKYFDLMSSSDPLNHKLTGKTEQGGIGFYSFCEKCNNFLGNEYVRPYKNWFNAGMALIRDNESKGFTYEAHNQKPNRILKQVLSMFLAINAETFLENEPSVRKYILDPNTVDLSPNIRVFTYLNRGPKWRYLGLMVNGNLSTGSMSLVSEITFPPYGYVLLLNNPSYSNHKLTEITPFKELNENGSYTIPLHMNVLETILPFPLDYRSKKEVELKIEKDKKL